MILKLYYAFTPLSHSQIEMRTGRPFGGQARLFTPCGLARHASSKKKLGPARFTEKNFSFELFSWYFSINNCYYSLLSDSDAFVAKKRQILMKFPCYKKCWNGWAGPARPGPSKKSPARKNRLRAARPILISILKVLGVTVTLYTVM